MKFVDLLHCSNIFNICYDSEIQEYNYEDNNRLTQRQGIWLGERKLKAILSLQRILEYYSKNI